MISRRQIVKGALAGASIAAFGRGAFQHASAQSTGTPEAAASVQSARLVDAVWLGDHLTDASLRIVALQSPSEFAGAHIPGAVQVDWPDLEITDTTPDSLANWRELMSTRFAALGIGPESTVIAYDPGTLWSARIWWVLDDLGFPDVRVLDGGLPAWTAADGAITADPSPALRSGSGSETTPNEGGIATIDEVQAALAAGDAVFVDARGTQEYNAGHIPGAINITYQQNAVAESPRLFKPADELRALYAGVNVTPDKLVIPYCTSGVRSAVTAFSLRLIGYPEVALFTGSWNEWSADPTNPITTGAKP